MTTAARASIPRAAVARLPIYLHALVAAAEAGTTTLSSEDLAVSTGATAAQVRRDLSSLGTLGTRGVGYEVDRLLEAVRHELGLTRDWRVLIVGAGNLGHALARYRGFAERGFHPVALVDSDATKVGERIEGLPVLPLRDLAGIVRRERIDLGVICVPATEAQAVAESLATAGVRSILNFAPVTLRLAPDVAVRTVDLSVEMQILTYYGARGARSTSRS